MKLHSNIADREGSGSLPENQGPGGLVRTKRLSFSHILVALLLLGACGVDDSETDRQE